MKIIHNVCIRNFYILLKSLSFLVVLMLPFIISAQRTFEHPGILHKRSDLDRMKYMVKVKVDPWYASYQLMKADKRSSYDYVIQGDPPLTKMSRENPCDNCKEYESDVWAALFNARMWYITGDSRHAEKTIEILNTWSNLTNFYGGERFPDNEIFYGQGTEPLSAGIYGAPIINAAEIIKSTYDGWDKADIDKFKAMLVYPGYSSTTVPTEDIANDNVTFYWRCYMFDAARHGNQELAPARTLMAMGIFLDNEIIYERGLRYVKGLPHRPDDLPYMPGPRIPTSLKSQSEYSISYNYKIETSIEDYGYEGVITNYIYDNGQCQESSRDQSHVLMGLAFISEIAEMAWNQGDNLYAWANNRLLMGLEYSLRYNASLEYSYPDQLTPWEPIEPDDFYQVRTKSACWKAMKISPRGRGRAIRRPAWEMPLNHYLMRMNIPEDSLKWLMRARDKSIEEIGYEQSGWNLQNPGWGGLTFRRPVNCQGDPCNRFINEQPVLGLNIFPGTLDLENYDYFPLNAGGGEGKTFHDISKGNSGGAYRSDGDVDIELSPGEGYNLTDLEPGEWVNYTVYIPENGTYEIMVQYAAGNGNGNIKFSFDGEDKTSEIPVPFGMSNSTGWEDWKDFTVTREADLNAGVQSMRIYIMGTGKAFKLSHVILKKV